MMWTVSNKCNLVLVFIWIKASPLRSRKLMKFLVCNRYTVTGKPISNLQVLSLSPCYTHITYNMRKYIICSTYFVVWYLLILFFICFQMTIEEALCWSTALHKGTCFVCFFLFNGYYSEFNSKKKNQIKGNKYIHNDTIVISLVYR